MHIMKASEAIARLSEMIRQHGDLELYFEGGEPLSQVTDVRKVECPIDGDGASANTDVFFVMLSTPPSVSVIFRRP
jgi:hypothetical protein